MLLILEILNLAGAGLKSAQDFSFFISRDYFWRGRRSIKKMKIWKKNAYLVIFKLWDRFWTLPDGPLDPLDRYKNPKISDIHNFWIIFFIFDPWPAIIKHFNFLGEFYIDPGGPESHPGGPGSHPGGSRTDPGAEKHQKN